MSDLNHILKVQIGDDKREIFASFGLVTELANLVQSIENVPALDLDPNLAMKVISVCLVPRDERGNPKEENYVPPEISADTAEKILTFAGEHCFDFFIRALERAAKRMKKSGARAQEAGQLLNSIAASPGESVSA